MTRQSTEYERGLAALGSASGALDAADLEHWFFGGWAVDLWVGRLTRPHDDIDVLVWRHDEARIHEALGSAGWLHTPTPEDLVGTNYARRVRTPAHLRGAGRRGRRGGASPGPADGAVDRAIGLRRRDLGEASVRVLTLEMMLAIKGTPRPDEMGGGKDRADLAALRSVVDGS